MVSLKRSKSKIKKADQIKQIMLTCLQFLLEPLPLLPLFSSSYHSRLPYYRHHAALVEEVGEQERPELVSMVPVQR